MFNFKKQQYAFILLFLVHLMYAPNNKYYRFNPMTESLLFLFYKKDKFMFSYTFLHFISPPVFFCIFFTIIIFCHFELKWAEIKAHVFEIHANY